MWVVEQALVTKNYGDARLLYAARPFQRAVGTLEAWICVECGLTEFYSNGLENLARQVAFGVYFVGLQGTVPLDFRVLAHPPKPLTR